MDLNRTTDSIVSRTSSQDSHTSSFGSHSDRKSSTSKLVRLLAGKSKRRSVITDYDNDNSRPAILTQSSDGPDVHLVDTNVDSDAEDVINVDESENSQDTSFRPGISPHHSHLGFLTVSSPSIPAESIVSSTSITASNKEKRLSLVASQEAGQRSSSPIGGRLFEAFTPNPKSSEDDLIPKEGSAKGSLFRGLSRNKRPDSTPPRIIADQQFVQEPSQLTPSPSKRRPNTPVVIPPSTPPPSAGRAPTTLITPPTPTENKLDNFDNSLSVRRPKSSHATSKLAHSIVNPLTPAVEEVFTPGGTATNPPTGFFSSVFTAAQNAATSLTNSISTSNKNKPGSSDSTQEELDVEEVILHTSQTASSDKGDSQKPAIETLGSGNLSLTHLGFTEPSNMSNSSSNLRLVENGSDTVVAQEEKGVVNNEDNAVSQAVAKAYNNNTEKPMASDRLSPEHSRISQNLLDESGSVIRHSIEPETASIRRTDSVRSRLSGGRRRRTRGSSDANSLSLIPSVTAGSRFTFASAKRNKDFHNLFKSVPEDDLLIEDYSAAYQREILLQGRLYVSEGHICFWSNIFGYVTNLVMSFDEVISVEKKSTAVIFQNGIAIQTMHARHGFASLMSRDSTYDLIISIWRTNNPNIRSSFNGAPVDGIGTGDRTDKTADNDDGTTASEELYDEHTDDDESNSFVEARDHSAAASDVGDSQKPTGRKASTIMPTTGSAPTNAKMSNQSTSGGTDANNKDYPGSSTHEPTDCDDASSHCEKPLIEATIPAPLGKAYSMLFGPSSAAFMQRFLTEAERCTELQQLQDNTGLTNDSKSRTYTYIKPLGGAIGPRQTKCIITESLEQFDLEKAVSVLCSTQTPDVPSGNAFVVKTRYCLMWGPGNGTKIVITYAVEWSGKSWLKGPIEKGAGDGQLTYANGLVSAMKAGLNKSLKNKSGKPMTKGGRRKRDGDAASPEPQTVKIIDKNSNSGILSGLVSEPTNLVIVLLAIVVLILLFRGSKGNSTTISSSDRRAMYEDMWKTEEHEIWKWIEDRAGVQQFQNSNPNGKIPRKRFSKSLESTDLELQEAIRVTKERLGRLEESVKKSNEKKEL